MFFRSEFDAAISDSTNRLWVLWADDEPVAMVLIATDIAATRYLSQPFFERHFTDHARRGAVHYILFVVVHPRYAAKGALTRMARDVLGTEAAEGVLLVFDSPEINQPRDDGGVALMMERLANMVVSGAPLGSARRLALLLHRLCGDLCIHRGSHARAGASRATVRRACSPIAGTLSRKLAGFATVWANESHLGPTLPMTAPTT